jgi:peptide/nickel transport system permease protein
VSARTEGLWAQTWRRFRRHRAAMASMIVLALLFGACLAVPLIVPAKESVKLNFKEKLEPPSAAHPFGTNTMGQDYLVRSLYGGRVSLRVGLQAMLIALAIGTLLGSIAGYRGGWADAVIMRAVDVVLSIPIFFVLLLLASFALRSTAGEEIQGGTSINVVALIIGFTSWTEICRLVRASFLSLREKEFVEAARALGAPGWRIVVQHLLPNSASPIIIAATLGMAGAIITESALSYLGFGVQPPQVSWGSMLRTSQPNLADQPWLAFFPGLLIFLTVLAFNFLGDGLRDAMDPRTGKR